MDRVAHQPAAQGHRHRRDRRDRAQGEGPAGRRQHLRQPVPAAAAAPRCGPRDALDDEVHRRPLRRGRRGGRRPLPRAARAPQVHPERRGRGAPAVRQLARPPRREDPRRADGAAFRERPGDRRVALRAPSGQERELPGAPDPPAARHRAPADAELRRDAQLRAEDRRRGRREAARRAHPDLRARRIARRRRVAHRGPARDDPRLGARHEARAAGRPHPALGRHRERRRSHRGPRARHRMNLAVAFGAGILSFLSPCVLPLVPAYLVNLAGESALSGADRRRTIAHAAAFVAGFSLVFTLLWVAIALLGSFGGVFVDWLQKIAWLALLVLRIHMLRVITIPCLERATDLRLEGTSTGYRRSILIGIAFGAGWTPCIGPYLALLLKILLDADLASRAGLLAAYSLGLGVPFLLVSARLR